MTQIVTRCNGFHTGEVDHVAYLLYRLVMFHRALSIIVFVAFFAAGKTAAGANNARANQALDRAWKALSTSPNALEAELHLIAVFDLWDALDPQRIMRALERAEALPRASVRVRERAGHLLAQGKVRLGDIESAEAFYRERGFIEDWFVAGPFDNEGGTGFDSAFPPEKTQLAAIVPTQPMPGKTRDVYWRPSPKQISFLGYNHLEALFASSINTCAYATTALHSETSGQGVLRIGAGGAVRVFWNGREALVDKHSRGPDPDRSAVAVRVQKGVNRLLLKVCAEEDRHLGFYARLTDRTANPWPLTPVENLVKALDHPIQRGPTPRSIPQPLEILLSRAQKHKSAPKDRATAARYLLYTDSVERSSHFARDTARSACLDNPSPANCILWTELALDRNERRLALDHARSASPRSAQVLLALARLEGEGPEVYRALPHIDRVLAVHPDDLEARALEIEVVAAQGFPLTAFFDAEKLAEQHPRIPHLLELAADLAERTGRVADALRLNRQKVALRFDDISKHEVLARASLAVHDRAVVTKHLRALLRLAPFRRDLLTVAGRFQEGMGQIDDAEKYYRASVDIAPHDPAAIKDLGLFLTRHNRTQEGVRILKEALSIQPQDAWLADYLSFLTPNPRYEEPYMVPPEVFLSQQRNQDQDEKLRLLVDQTVVRVYESGLSSRFRQIVARIESLQAARAWRVRSIQYSPSSQRIKVLAAKVYRSDGAVESSVARGTVPISEPWYRLYYDVEAEVIELPPLELGDIVELSYRLDDTAHRNVFNDYFGDFVFIEEEHPKDLWRYVLIAPPSRRFHFNQIEYDELQHETRKDANLIAEMFEARDIAAINPEQGMPGLTSAAAYMHVSTYTSWNELGTWYRGLIRHQLSPDERIREKVRELTGALSEDLAKVQAIYEWVVSATRYVGLEFGIHGYKPYRVPLVVSRGFGDCKDKASLLVAMLGEAGIEAEFALVRTRDLGDITGTPASLSVFNHAIVYVPGVDLWLDGTAEHHGPGEFPFGDQGTASLRIRKDDAVFGQTPVMPPEQNSQDATVEMLLDPDGDANLTVHASIRGRRAAILRQKLESVQTRRERFEAALARTFPGARLGELETISLADLKKPVEYNYTAFVPGLGKKVGGSLEVPVDIGLGLISRFGRVPTRQHDLVVGPTFVSSRSVTVPIPARHRVTQLPSAAIIESRFGKLSFESHERAGSVRVSRRFELTAHRITTKDYPDFIDFCRRVDDVLAGRIQMEEAR